MGDKSAFVGGMRVKLGDYIKEYSVKNKNNEDIPVYSVSNSLGFCKDYFGKEVASKNKTTYKIVPRGCFAYNPSRINVGSVDWQNEEERVIVSPLYNVFSVSPLLDQQYLLYYLKSNVTLSRIRAVASGSVRDNLKLSMLYEFPIDLISLDQQYEVVSILNAVQKIIDLYQKELSGLDELVRARFMEMFGDPITNDKHLKLQSLFDLSVLKAGKSIKTGELSEVYDDETLMYPCFGGNGIRGYINRYSHDGEYPVIGRQGAWAGNVNYATGKFYATEHAIVVTPKVELNTVWYYYGLKYIDLTRFQTGAAQPGLAVDKLNKVIIPFPTIKLQNQFASFVEEIDKSRSRIQKSLEASQELFDSLMQEYFG